MEQRPYDTPRPRRRRRRRRSQFQIFKEDFLPAIILLAAIINIVILCVGSYNYYYAPANDSVLPRETLDQNAAQQQEARNLMAQADQLARSYDYLGAVDLLTSFSGDMTTVEGMVDKYEEYGAAYASLIRYTDLESIPHLSTGTLIADLDAALSDENGDSYNTNFLTTKEFKTILQNLYNRDYVLVSLHDIAEKSVNEDEEINVSKGELMLPEGKKPIVLTQIVNGLGNTGFASRVVLDANGALTSELADGTTGSYDLIPVLNDFVAQHPDFSYHGAKATIAIIGQNGILGHSAASSEVSAVIDALRAGGFDIACCTYSGGRYGEMTLEQIQADMVQWNSQLRPVLGDVDILIYPNGSDIGTQEKYSGVIYQYLMENGFSYFISQDSDTRAWGQLTDTYLRQTRRNLAPGIMYYSYSYYEDLFDAREVLDSDRGKIPY